MQPQLWFHYLLGFSLFLSSFVEKIEITYNRNQFCIFSSSVYVYVPPDHFIRCVSITDMLMFSSYSYPTDTDKLMLAKQTGLSRNQVKFSR
jgi:hypothetical protein